MKKEIKRAVAMGLATGLAVAPVMMDVNEINAAYGVSVGNQYTTTWTSSDNGKTKDYQITIKGNKLSVKLQQMQFQNGKELEWTVKLINSSGSLVGTLNTNNCPVSNFERVATFNNLKAGTYTVRLDPNLHIYDGTVNVGLSFSESGATTGTTSDWKTHWASSAIQEGMDKGWVVKADIFRPNDAMTRAEVVKVINKAYGLKGSTSLPFKDVKSSDWFYDEVKTALANNLISSDVNFRPNDKITRQEFAVMIANIETNKVGDPVHDKIKKYTDYSNVAGWALNGAEYVVEKGYMGAGGKEFNPVNNITRAEVLTTLSRIK